MSMGLTASARRALNFIESYTLTQGGVAPSFKEMADELGLKGKSGIARLMRELEERGHIRRIYRKSRAIEVLRPSPGVLGLSPTLSARVRLAAAAAGITPAALVEHAVLAWLNNREGGSGSP